MVLHNLFGLKTLAIGGITSPFPLKAVGKFSLKEGAKRRKGHVGYWDLLVALEQMLLCIGHCFEVQEGIGSYFGGAR